MAQVQTPALTPGARRILDAAERLFYAQGIHAVGVEAIAAEAGMTKRTLYNRFGSKEALVAAYLRQRHERWWVRLQERLAVAPEPRVLAVFDSYRDDADGALHGCAFLNAAAELRGDHPGLTVIREHKQAVREKVQRLIAAERGKEAAQRLAEHVFLLLEGAIAQRGVDPDGRSLEIAQGLARELLAA